MKFHIALVLLASIYQIGMGQSKKSIDSLVYAEMKKFKIPGLGLVVVKDGKTVMQGSYGKANIEFSVPATSKTIFQLASATKLFTGTLVMKLVEEGSLSLEQPITTYLSDLPTSWGGIKIKHLLSHTHGMVDFPQTRAWQQLSEDDRDKLSALDIVRLTAQESLEFIPGDQFSYSIIGYVTLAAIVEKVMGQTFDQVISKKIFKPLSMTASSYGDHRAVIKNRNANQYTYQRGSLENWPFQYGSNKNGSAITAAGLNTTTSDLAKFFIALDNEKIISRKSIDIMTNPFHLNNGKSVDYGLGWAMHKIPNFPYTIAGHEGGSCTWIYYVKEKRLLIGVLTNLTGSHADEIIDNVVERYGYQH